MIGRLTGTVLHEDLDGSVLLDVRGVGYELLVPLGALGRATASGAGEELILYVHTHVREDALELFGFASELERRVFRLLLSVPNVGPKTALGVMGAMSPSELLGAVQQRDMTRLGQVPGIGKKTAERLVLELKDKLARLTSLPAASPAAPQHAKGERLMAALVGMGYRPVQAERAVKALASELDTLGLEALLKEALRVLAS